MVDEQPTPVMIKGEAGAPQHTTSTRIWGKPLIAMRIAWFAIVGLTVVLSLMSMPQIYQRGIERAQEMAPVLVTLGISPQFVAGHTLLMQALMRLTFIATALVMFWRRSDDRIAIFVSLMLATWGNSVTGGIFHADAGPVLNTLSNLVMGIGHAAFAIFLFTMPNGRFWPDWTRWPVYAWSVWALAASLFPTSPINPTTSLGDMGSVAFFLPLYGSAHLLQTIRQKYYYNAQQKQQIKWIVVGLSIALILGFLVAFVPELIYPALSINETATGILWDLFSNTMVSLALMAIPITIAFSIQRYRLWDVDFVINRGLLYGILTAMLGLLFVGTTLLVQWGVRRFTGQDQSPVAYAVSAVVIGVTFQPVRTRLQRFIDKTFYGINVDYRKEDTPVGLNYQGTFIGPYQIQDQIGKGGMAEVYKGLHPTLGRTVAIKVLPPRLAAESDFRTRFEREAQTIAALRHPNIIQVYDFGELEGTYYMVMEYIAGKDLSAYVREHKRLPLHEVTGYIHDIGGALDYAHEQGVIHRDVKPSNVMLQPRTADGTNSIRDRAILMDFGIAKLAGGSTGLTKTGMMGTLDYIAPEQIRASKEVDGRADVYALGIMAYQMLTGQLPFTGDNPGAVLIAHMQTPPPDVRKLVPNIAPHVAEAIMRAMAKEPESRFKTAGEFAAALEAQEADD